MSTAVYYSNHNMSVDDIHSKHTLPSLAQIMPIDQTTSGLQGVQQSQQQQGQGNEQSISPTLVNSNMISINNLPLYNEQKLVHQPPQPSPDLFSNNSQPSTANTTPASSFSSQESGYLLTSLHTDEKCTCKSSANRIPRPRNAFILFRQKYHQSVLDEGSVIRTNPEVSRELGRRWRSLSAEEKDHWNNLAEEEKKSHAKKYPGYRYTPRRNGKNKGCPACRKKTLRQQQVQLHNQEMMQLQQEQYQQYLQLQQQLNQQSSVIPQNSNFINSQPITQFIVPNPYQPQQQPLSQQLPQQTFQFSFNNELSSTPQQSQQERLSPLSSIPGQFTIHNNSQDFLGQVPVNPQLTINYDLAGHSNHQGPFPPTSQLQRFNSLPTPVSGANTNYGFDVFSINQQSQP